MMEEYNEYATFTVTNKAGQEVELAIIDEFEFEKKTYVVGAIIEGDTINEEGVFIYRAKFREDELLPEKITNPVEYKRVIRAYTEMEEDTEKGEADDN